MAGHLDKRDMHGGLSHARGARHYGILHEYRFSDRHSEDISKKLQRSINVGDRDPGVRHAGHFANTHAEAPGG
jgi:hypothetical protein